VFHSSVELDDYNRLRVIHHAQYSTVLRIAYPFLPMFFDSADEETSACVPVTFDFSEEDMPAGKRSIQLGS
jgi:hypothetical protein